MSVLSYQTVRPPRPLWPTYAAESLSSVSTTLLTIGIFFFTEHYFQWGLRENLLLAAGQGAAYVVGSLASQHLAGRFGRRRGLIAVLLLLTVLPVTAMQAVSPFWMVATLILYMLFASMVWPALESLVCSDADAHTLSKRVGTYNLVWSSTNAVTLALSGVIIANWRSGLFVIPAVAHLASAVLLLAVPSIDPSPAGAADVAAAAPAHEAPEPGLLAQRTLALWLARIALPATYVVVYSLSAMMPLLPVLRPLGTASKTAVASVWMASRLLAFLALGSSTWWHTRPRILLGSAAIMLLAFWGVTVPVSDTYEIALSVMIAAQLVLGVVMGVIYAGSLYFGMVLSDGSTEHGGYHEALIGLGSVIGPGVAALTQWRWPGDLRAGVAAVSGVIVLSILAAGWATIAAKRRPTP